MKNPDTEFDERKEKAMKKGFVTTAAAMMMGTMVLGFSGNVFAAGTTIEDAQRTALEAAGVSESQVIFEKRGTSFDDGREIYEIDFFIPGEIKYDFDIDTATGMIVDQDQDLWEPEDDFEFAALMNDHAATEVSGEITKEQAKELALKDAGFSEAEVFITKCKKDFDDGIEKFEIEFSTGDGREFEYGLRVSDGAILEKNMDFDD